MVLVVQRRIFVQLDQNPMSCRLLVYLTCHEKLARLDFFLTQSTQQEKVQISRETNHISLLHCKLNQILYVSIAVSFYFTFLIDILQGNMPDDLCGAA